MGHRLVLLLLCAACTKTAPAREEAIAIAPAAPSAALALPPPDAGAPAAQPDASATAAAPEDAGEAPIPCTSIDDCWIEARRPIARPKALRGKKFKPCKDGEVAPACTAGVCGRVAYKC